MAHSIQCTHCSAVLKSAKPIAAGAKVKCPKCAKVFIAAEMAEETESAPAPDDNPFATMGPGDPTALSNHKTKKSPMTMILLGCGSLLLCTCCCGGGIPSWLYQEDIKTWFTSKTEEGKKGRDKDKDKGKGQTIAIQDLRQFADEVTRGEEARKKYEGNYVELTAPVERVVRLSDQSVGIVSDVDGVYLLEFKMRSTDIPKSTRLTRDQKVKLKGKFREVRNQGFIVFESVEFMEAEASKIVETSSEKMMDEFLKDEQGARTRYQREFILRGPIAEFIKQGPEDIVLKLASPLGTSVFLAFGPEEIREAEKLAKAKSVVVRAGEANFEAFQKRLQVRASLVIESK